MRSRHSPFDQGAACWLAYAARRIGSIASRLMLLASATCIVVAVVALYARSAILDPGHFSDRAVATLGQDEVADEIAARFTTNVIERTPELVTLQPAVEAAAADVARSPDFAAEFGAGMRELHRGVFTGSAPRPALRVPGMTAQVRASMARRTPAARPAGAGRSRPVADVDRRQCPRAGPARRRLPRRWPHPARAGRPRPRAAGAPARGAARARPAPRGVGERARARRAAARSSPAGRARERSCSKASTPAGATRS